MHRVTLLDEREDAKKTEEIKKPVDEKQATDALDQMAEHKLVDEKKHDNVAPATANTATTGTDIAAHEKPTLYKGPIHKPTVKIVKDPGTIVYSRTATSGLQAASKRAGDK